MKILNHKTNYDSDKLYQAYLVTSEDSQFKMCKDIDFTEIMYKETEGMEGTKGTIRRMKQIKNKP